MAGSQKRLGRGLSSLVSTATSSRLDDRLSIRGATDSSPADLQKGFLTRTVAVGSIVPNPRQPRKNISDHSIQRLAESIASNGLIQPVVVRKCPPSPEDQKSPQTTVKYELIAGERRWRAALAAGLTDLPVIIREADEQAILELALIENIQREDLNAIDRAKAYKQFQDRFGLTAEAVGQRVGEDRTTVSNYLRLLDLPQTIQDLVAGDLLSMGHARAMIGVADPEVLIKLAQAVVLEGLSVRDVEELVRKQRTPQQRMRERQGKKEKRAHIRDLERQFSRALRTKVQIEEGARKHRGKIIIQYQSVDDFDRIREHLGVEL